MLKKHLRTFFVEHLVYIISCINKSSQVFLKSSCLGKKDSHFRLVTDVEIKPAVLKEISPLYITFQFLILSRIHNYLDSGFGFSSFISLSNSKDPGSANYPPPPPCRDQPRPLVAQCNNSQSYIMHRRAIFLNYRSLVL